MILTWFPDFSPSGQCILEIQQGHTGLIKVVRFCPYHQSLKDGGLTDAETFTAILQSSRVKEAARWAAKLALALDKEHPGVPYRVDADGGFTLGVDRTGTRMSGWPSGGQTRTRLINDINAAVAGVSKPSGTSPVRVG